MEVKILHHTPLSVAVIGGRTCWQSFHKGGCYSEMTDDITETDKEFLDRIVNKNKHQSVSEHLVAVVAVKDISQDILIEMYKNKFIDISEDGDMYIISFNFRSLYNLNISTDLKVKMCPKPWLFLLEK